MSILGSWEVYEAMGFSDVAVFPRSVMGRGRSVQRAVGVGCPRDFSGEALNPKPETLNPSSGCSRLDVSPAALRNQVRDPGSGAAEPVPFHPAEP